MTVFTGWPVWLELTVLTVAVWRVTRVLVGVDGFPPVEWLRLRLLARWPAEDSVFPDEGVVPDVVFPSLGSVNGRPVQFVDGQGWVTSQPHWLGLLVSCVWCAGFWVAVLATAGWVLAPSWTLMVATPFAMSGLVGVISERNDG